MGEVSYYADKPIDFELIASTYKLAFNKPLGQHYWEWRFLANPNSPKIYMSYTVENGELASYYAVSPNTLHTKDGHLVPVALSNMTMTHPAYSGKGYFRLLASSLYDRLRQDDFVAVYGFANSFSHYAFRRYLGWIDIAELNTMQLDRAHFRRRSLSVPSYNISVSQANRGHVSRVQEFVFSSSKLHLGRNTDNLMWRFVDNAQNTYYALEVLAESDCAAIMLFKYYGTDIDIMEIFVDANFLDDYEGILRKGFNHLFNAGAGNIHIWSNLHTEEHLLLETLGFVESGFSSYFGFVPLLQGDGLEDLADVRNWHYRFMDSDNF